MCKPGTCSNCRKAPTYSPHPAPPNCSRREILLVGLWLSRSHRHGQDRQGPLVHLHTESRKERDGIPPNGREGGLTAGLAVRHAREKELMRLKNRMRHRPAECVSTRNYDRYYEMSRRGVGAPYGQARARAKASQHIWV